MPIQSPLLSIFKTTQVIFEHTEQMMELEAVYEMIQDKNRNTAGPQTGSQNRTESLNRKKWLVWITVCLGLICVLLVTALVVLYIHLTAERDQMKMRNMNIAEEYNETLSSLSDERDQMKTRNMNIAEEYNETLNSLKINFSHLTDERDQLQINLTSMSETKLELETKVKNLNGALNNFPKPGSVWYYISSEKKSWSDSRQFCRDHGGDLVVINTEEEQRFISSVVKERAWIGLSDIEKEGNMKWVDNKPLNKGFWYQDEPNDAKGNEDCVEIRSSAEPSLNNWNDSPCSDTRKCICEKWG